MHGDLIYVSGSILMGVAAILAGILIPDKHLLPKRKRYKERNPESYIKACRKALFYLGVYYIFLGIIVIFIAGNPIYSTLYEFMLPILTLLPLIVIVKKYA
jgi:hypothetical protein